MKLKFINLAVLLCLAPIFTASAQSTLAQVRLEAVNPVVPSKQLLNYTIGTNNFGDIVQLPIMFVNDSLHAANPTYLNRLVLEAPTGYLNGVVVSLRGIAHPSYALSLISSYSSTVGDTKVFSISGLGASPENLCVLVDYGDDFISGQQIGYVMSDFDKNGTVGDSDFIQFRNVFLAPTGPPVSPLSVGYAAYLAKVYFNLKGYGVVDGNDFLGFRLRFGQTYPAGTPCLL